MISFGIHPDCIGEKMAVRSVSFFLLLSGVFSAAVGQGKLDVSCDILKLSY